MRPWLFVAFTLAVGFTAAMSDQAWARTLRSEDPAPGTASPRTGATHTPTAPADAPTSAAALPHPRYLPGRVVVKFTDAVPACAHCLFSDKRPFPDGLQPLHADAGVLRVTPLFRTEAEDAHLRGRQKDRGPVARGALTQDWQERAARVRQQFARRSRRAAPTDQPLPDVSHVYLYDVSPKTDVEALCARWRRHAAVEYCHPDYVITSDFTPNDPYYHTSGAWGQSFDDLWGLKKIAMGTAWDQQQGAGAVVAVVDWGVDDTHPELSGRMWQNAGETPANGLDDDGNGYVDDVRGWNFSDNNNNPMDGSGHGTHVAGTIAAAGHNALGVIGVAPQTSVMALKAIPQTGYGTTATYARAMQYAALNGADVISNSWTCSSCSDAVTRTAVEDAVRVAYGLGAVIVFSAGNDNVDMSNIPIKNMPEVIKVASTTYLDQKSSFSNYGPLLDVAAPGSDILSLRAAGATQGTPVGDRYSRMSGTSMAAPHVSGLAALLVAAHANDANFTNESVRQLLRATADDIGAAGFDVYTGYGRINAARALAPQTPQPPQALIMAPAEGALLDPQQSPAVTVRGTAAGGAFQSYRLWYRATAAAVWEPVGEASLASVTSNTLGIWTIGGLADGAYVLRLVVTAGDGATYEHAVTVTLSRANPYQLTGDQLTSGLRNRVTPDISGRYAVWAEHQDTAAHIFLYDFATKVTRQLTTDAAWHYNSRVDGVRVLYDDNRSGNWDVYLYDVAAGQETPLTTSANAERVLDVLGDRVFWLDYGAAGGNATVYVRDLADGTTRPLLTPTAQRGGFSVSGNRLVYHQADCTGGSCVNHIYLHELATGTTRRLTNHPTAHQQDPDIWGNLVVWRDYRYATLDNPSDAAIFLYDLSTGVERELAHHGASLGEPHIDRDLVVWADYRTSPSVLYLYDLATQQERPALTGLTTWADGPELAAGQVIWGQYFGGNGQIYAARIKEVAPNQPPVLGALASQTVVAGQSLSVALTASDPNNDPVGLMVSALPLGASFDLATGRLTWTPSVDQAGSYTLTVSATDPDGLRDVQVLPITVTLPLNQPPVWSPIGNKTIAPNKTLQFTVAATDPEGSPVTYAAVPLPAGATFSNQVFRWKPTSAQVGGYQVTFTASDGQMSVGTTITITVQSGGGSGGGGGGKPRR